MHGRVVCCARVARWAAVAVPETPTRFSLIVAIVVTLSLGLANAVAVVQALNLYHQLAVSAIASHAAAMRHGLLVVALEQRLHLAVEPDIQHHLAAGVTTPAGLLSGALLRHLAVWLYLHAHPSWLFAALVWSYLYHQVRFARLRDLTILSAFLSVACYRLFPAAPPRFVLHGAPAYVQDWTYGGCASYGSVVHHSGFNPYGAFPSVHVVWSCIPALCLVAGCRRRWVWLAASAFPLTMVATVISTGNHYVVDCVGAIGMLLLSYPLIEALARLRRWARTRLPARRVGYELPAAGSLCLLCAGMMALTSAPGGSRALLAIAIIVLLVVATIRSPYLWHGRRRLAAGRQPLRHLDYAAGILFVAGSAAAGAGAGQEAHWDVRVCSLLWLAACLCALTPHLVMRREHTLWDHAVRSKRALALHVGLWS